MTYTRFNAQMFARWNETRARRRQRRPPRRTTTSSEPTSSPSPPHSFRQIIGHENLLRVYDQRRRRGGQAPGVDGYTYTDFSRAEIADVLRGVSRSILAGTYLPDPTRAVRIPKPNGGYRVLHLPTIVDRVVAAAVADYLTRLIDPAFSARSFGFRPRRGVWSLLIELERLVLSERRVVVAQDDIRAAFDNVPITLALECFARHVTDPDLLNLVGIILRGHDGPERTVGIGQGNSLSPLALNVTLDYVQDQPTTADPAHPPVLRYADNLFVVAQTVAEARQALQRAVELLTPHGLSLKREDRPVILSRQGARANLLGFQIGLEDNRLRIELGPGAYQKLEQALEEVHVTENPPQIAKDVIGGWISSYSPGFESVDVSRVAVRICEIAARKGFRELGSANSLERHIRKAIAHWIALRDGLDRDRSATGINLDWDCDALRAAPFEVPF